MQDIIQRIIEIDQRAQKMTDEALALKSEAERSVEADKKALREKYIEKARKRIDLTSEAEKKFLAESLEEIEKKYSVFSSKFNEVYEHDHDKWVAEIYNRVIGG